MKWEDNLHLHVAKIHYFIYNIKEKSKKMFEKQKNDVSLQSFVRYK